MGLRNPFRIEVDPKTDAVYVADYSPDADEADPARGPAGHGKWTVITEPGNYGWPYCATAELPYVDYDFATEESGETFDCDAPINGSPNNTGRIQLPAVVQPHVWYSYGVSPQFPEMGEGGIGPMAGPAYDFDRSDRRGPQPVGWPRYYDGMPLFYEWTRDYVKGIRLEPDGELASIEDVDPVDRDRQPDGHGVRARTARSTSWSTATGSSPRIRTPSCRGSTSSVRAATAARSRRSRPLRRTVRRRSRCPSRATARSTRTATGSATRGTSTATATSTAQAQDPTHTYRANGVYRATLTVTDVGGRHRGRHASADVDIVVGNQAPTVELVAPVAGQPFQFGDTVQFEVNVTDDQPVDCNAVTVTYILGHDEHGHPQTTASGCTGSIEHDRPERARPVVRRAQGGLRGGVHRPRWRRPASAQR